MRCRRCGHHNPEGSRFCVECGAALAHARPGPATTAMAALDEQPTALPASFNPCPPQAHADAVKALPAGAALLIVQRGPAAGCRFVLDQPVTTVGREPDNDIFLDDVTVSRRHAEIHRRDGGFIVRDVGSLNGTCVNHQQVHEAVLASGDHLQFGKFRFLYLTDATPSAQGNSLNEEDNRPLGSGIP